MDWGPCIQCLYTGIYKWIISVCVYKTRYIHNFIYIMHHAHSTARHSEWIHTSLWIYFMHTHSLVLLQFDASIRAVLEGLPFLCPSPETRRPLNRELLISSTVAMAQSHTIAMMSLWIPSNECCVYWFVLWKFGKPCWFDILLLCV